MKRILLFLFIVFIVQINAQTPNDTTVKDFTIVKNKIPNYMLKDWTMNGKLIDGYTITKRLLLFKSSELQYRKSEKGKIPMLICLIVGTLSGVTSYVLDAPDVYANPPRKVPLLGGVLFDVMCVSITTDLLIVLKSRLHYKKAIKLYNQEIIK
jgi:hypothetical protein